MVAGEEIVTFLLFGLLLLVLMLIIGRDGGEDDVFWSGLLLALLFVL